MSEDEALALSDARIEDSVTCEGCGESVNAVEVLPSPYEADDGGCYCLACAQAEWTRAVEEAHRLREALQQIALLEPDHWQHAGLKRHAYAIRRLARAALASAGGEGTAAEGTDDAGE